MPRTIARRRLVAKPGRSAEAVDIPSCETGLTRDGAAAVKRARSINLMLKVGRRTHEKGETGPISPPGGGAIAVNRKATRRPIVTHCPRAQGTWPISNVSGAW